MFRILGLVVVLAGLVEVVIPGDRHFQGFMWGLAAMALVCAFAWVVVQLHDHSKIGAAGRDWNPSGAFRCFFCLFAVAGYAMVAIAEPDCGYAGHSACYRNCFVVQAPGAHFAFSQIPVMFFYVILPWQQTCNPFSCVLPDIPFWGGQKIEEEEQESGSAPAAEQVPPSAEAQRTTKDEDVNPEGPVP